MTNPPQGEDPSKWSRPTQANPAQPVGATERIERVPGAEARPTERIERPDAVDPATAYIPRQDAPPPAAPGAVPPPEQPKKGGALGRLFKDPLSIVLVLVIVVALVIAGVLGGELYARNRADSIVSKIVSCVVQDKATASFGVVPPFLWQHANKHYTNLSIKTEGNQVRDAKGMKLDININDIKLSDNPDASGGTVGSMVARIDWSSDGIKQSVQNAIPLFGGFISNVTTDPGAGTLTLDAGLGSVTVRPEVVNGGFSMEVMNVSGLGFSLPRETVQPALDMFTGELTKNYPMEIHADSVEVTDSGIVAQLSSQNSTIPPGTEDPCFSAL
ncbi:hypothetical protein MCNF_40510 [Mycolicibacterium confluentis]|uniref:DUF2993 domain-containing protein n=1 Tax=Mycolicibacterium confluentis TaxID=28047 RepID=A0A7I7Y1F6_9MYCO|nr:DUF2993 domain-containing protein [Mycolicibacterium confluentis]MCV7320407.1 DUF2993 domain-containing protein [Mycolicibacterium confluentis]BBZ35446.1 hypothetical protein MCNF_40510 [Mycolicibacterium confluentis]